MGRRKIQQRYKLDEKTGCWIWLLGKQSDGYGITRDGKKVRLAHVIEYEKKYGTVPFGLELDHVICNRRVCVNPDHVKPVTHLSNIMRGNAAPAINARKTHCIRGHELAGENLITNKYGRQCRICKNARAKENKRKQREKNPEKAKQLNKLYYLAKQLRGLNG